MCFETVGGMDADAERTGMYSQRVSKLICQSDQVLKKANA